MVELRHPWGIWGPSWRLRLYQDGGIPFTHKKAGRGLMGMLCKSFLVAAISSRPGVHEFEIEWIHLKTFSNDFNFFHYNWFTVFYQFRIVIFYPELWARTPRLLLDVPLQSWAHGFFTAWGVCFIGNGDLGSVSRAGRRRSPTLSISLSIYICWVPCL